MTLCLDDVILASFVHVPVLFISYYFSKFVGRFQVSNPKRHSDMVQKLMLLHLFFSICKK